VELGIGCGIQSKEDSSNYLIVAVALILAGAFGNIIDSVFYGVILMTVISIGYIVFRNMALIFTVK
jgi:lipoprotein signal peptidase